MQTSSGRKLSISRRTVLGGVALLALHKCAQAEPLERLSVDGFDGTVVLNRYSLVHAAKRPAVLILHGGRGVELNPLAYERYANALAAAGIDAYLVQYFTSADREALGANNSPRSRDDYRTARFEGWTKRISSVVSSIMARADSSGRIGLLGFSLGGFVAADTAARDERVAALAVMYGGMPNARVSLTKRLPPLIELHGDADTTINPVKGEELVRLAKSLGGIAEHVVYAGRTHGFDFSGNDPMTFDAIGRIVAFFQARLVTD
jgi:carboxymethylenebutenolidase